MPYNTPIWASIQITLPSVLALRNAQPGVEVAANQAAAQGAAAASATPAGFTTATKWTETGASLIPVVGGAGKVLFQTIFAGVTFPKMQAIQDGDPILALVQAQSPVTQELLQMGSLRFHPSSSDSQSRQDYAAQALQAALVTNAQGDVAEQALNILQGAIKALQAPFDPSQFSSFATDPRYPSLATLQTWNGALTPEQKTAQLAQAWTSGWNGDQSLIHKADQIQPALAAAPQDAAHQHWDEASQNSDRQAMQLALAQLEGSRSREMGATVDQNPFVFATAQTTTTPPAQTTTAPPAQTTSSPGGGQTMNPIPGVWVRGQQVGPVLVQATQIQTGATSWTDASGTPIPAPDSVWTAPVGPGPAGTASADLYWGQWSGVWYVVAPPGVTPPPPTSQPPQAVTLPPGPNLWTEVGFSPVPNAPVGTPVALSAVDSWATASGAPLPPPSQFIAAPGGLYYAVYSGAWWQVTPTPGADSRRRVQSHKTLLQQFLAGVAKNFAASFGQTAGQNAANGLFNGGGGSTGAAPVGTVYELVAQVNGQVVPVNTPGARYFFADTPTDGTGIADPQDWQTASQGQPPSAWGLPVPVVLRDPTGAPRVVSPSWLSATLGPNWAANLPSS